RGAALGKRAAQLLVPMLFISNLWIWYFPHSGLQSPLDSTFKGLWLETWKNGYWFTLVLFEIIAAYAAVKPMLDRAKNVAVEIAVYTLAWGVIFLAYKLFYDTNLFRLLSVSLVVDFFPVFCFGAFAHRHRTGFEKAVESSGVFTIAFIAGAVALYFECWPWEFEWLDQNMQIFVRVILHISLAIIGIAVVKPWSMAAFGDDAPKGGRRVARMWSYIGRESLAIYLLHYFFLFPLGVAREALTSCGLAFVPLLVFSAAVAAAVVAIVLCVNRLLQPSELLSWLMCGRLPRFISGSKK
ncbi:MAG: acyltransferase, partial [Muribaculaceae bacterium]|nr:acyltransferase [Muribaculaceae bacterium]